jgi:carboxymethylenebutenolidase
MSLKTEWVPYGPGGEYAGYLAYEASAKKPLPGVLVVQEAWGVDAHIEDVTRRFASAGYVAFAPDLFAKRAQRPAPLLPDRLHEMLRFMDEMGPARIDPKAREAALAAQPAPLAERLRETIGTLFAGGFLPPLAAAASFLRRELPFTRGRRIGSLGFCMGGGLSAALATVDPELACAVMFYGRMPPEGDIPRIGCPVLAFYGREDRVLVDAIPAFQQAMARHGKSLEVVVYEGAEHAFFNETRSTYEVDAARDSFVRALAFLRKNVV